VAYRVALKARIRSTRRRRHERQGMAVSRAPASVPNDPEQTTAREELHPNLHEEVNRLPDKYRLPVTLSYGP
jgi:DNA-directed RNA polymerase specialized sigma24 family protein